MITENVSAIVSCVMGILDALMVPMKKIVNVSPISSGVWVLENAWKKGLCAMELQTAMMLAMKKIAVCLYFVLHQVFLISSLLLAKESTAEHHKI